MAGAFRARDLALVYTMVGEYDKAFVDHRARIINLTAT